MLCKYGNYQLPEGRCEITRRDTPEFNEAKQLLSNTVRLDVSSALYADSPSQMDGLVRSLLRAFAVQGRDFLVYLPGGNVQSQLTMRGVGSIGGVHVVQAPELQAGQKGAYVTWLPFTFALECEYPSSIASLIYREFSESISYDSPERIDWLLCLHGQHQQQQVRQFPFYTATQSGRAVGYLSYPSPPSPIWPAAWVNSDTLPGHESPKLRGDTYTEFPITWQYKFKSNRPLTGSPTFWPL